jgi:hypothetical protein
VLLIGGLLAIGHAFGTRLAMGDVFRAQRFLFGLIRELVFFLPFLIAVGFIGESRKFTSD